ncbi:MAG: conjugal transfer protein TraV [Sphingomonadales bacterium 32-64-22]|nr:MAG: conjugal transfer protein TraV [Sphingomonadales bacterium 32-64-22]
MGFSRRILASACLAVLTSGCATFGTNVEGDFTCRAPKGDCAPSQVIDARATRDLSATGPVQDGPRPPVSVASGDQGRTSERTLRIVFPAHIDETGTLHDDAVAWAVVENPRWAAELRRKAGEDTAPPLMRQLRRQLKAAQAKSDLAREAVAGASAPAVEGFDMAQPPHDRTPRPSADKAPLIFPTIEAIEAAKNAAKAQKEPK